MSWREEDHLLHYFCRAEIDEKTMPRIVEAEKNGLDWSYLLENARENGVSAFLFYKLNENKINLLNIPSGILEELKKDYYLNAAQNTLIFEELGRVLRAFRKAGLPVIILKGAALAENAYGNIALRPMSDVDILIKREDLVHADEQLKMLGYNPTDCSVDDINLSSTYLTTLDYRRTPEHSLSFHVHWHFVNSTIPNESFINNIKMKNIWRDAEKTKIAGEETLVMAPYHLLIHLSEHALRVTHSLSKLSFLCDINQAVNFYRESLDWGRLIEESFEFKLNRMVYLSLYFTSLFLGTEIPQDVLLELKPERFSLFERIFMNFVSNNKQFPGLSYVVHLSMNKGLFKKMKFVGRTFFPPRQFIAQRSYISLSEVNFMHYLRRTNEVFSHLFKPFG